MFRFFKKKTTPDEPLPEDQATTPAPDLSISQNTSTEAPPDAADSPPVQGRRFMLSQALSGAPLGRQTGLPTASADIAQPSAAVPIVSVDAAQQPEAPAQELVQELVENQIEERAEEQTEEQAKPETRWFQEEQTQ